MKVIFICTDWFTPAFKAGGPIQSIANLVKNFNERITYKIFCSDTDLNNEMLKGIETDQWTEYNDHTQVWYASKKKLSKEIIQKEIRNSKATIIWINGIYSWFFNLVPLIFGKGDRKIVSVRGMLTPGALLQKKIKKDVYLRAWKILRLHRNSIFHATDEQEKEYIKKIFGGKTKVIVAQNFPRLFDKQSSPDKKPGILKLVSIALISPMKNILLVLEALGQTQDDIQITYDIYGPIKDEAYWKPCLQLIASKPKNVTINYHGDIVPSKVENALSQSHIFILPSKSENFGHSIFEALSTGKPVITSHNTPWNDLQNQKAGINVSIDNTKELTAAIHFFAGMNSEQLNEWSIGANQFAKKAIDFEKIKKQYQTLFFG